MLVKFLMEPFPVNTYMKLAGNTELLKEATVPESQLGPIQKPQDQTNFGFTFNGYEGSPSA